MVLNTNFDSDLGESEAMAVQARVLESAFGRVTETNVNAPRTVALALHGPCAGKHAGYLPDRPELPRQIDGLAPSPTIGPARPALITPDSCHVPNQLGPDVTVATVIALDELP
ncbi:MAG: hypothetical protein O7G84_19920 [Gammaproteobacteria bacterium]|nr:hypothetical protein [Gammaproteobacteria bacterium]